MFDRTVQMCRIKGHCEDNYSKQMIDTISSWYLGSAEWGIRLPYQPCMTANEALLLLYAEQDCKRCSNDHICRQAKRD
jgi:hypothetical protein